MPAVEKGGRSMRFIFRVLAVLIISVIVSPSSWAKVTIDPSFTGTLIVTLADGSVSIYESGDPLPKIPQGAMIEIFDGAVSIQTEAGDQVQLGCFGNGQAAGGGSSGELSCGPTSGLLKMDGKEYSFSSTQAQEAEPTADSNQPGVPSDQDPAPDSRSIQASTVG
jgi:hypothetical protein